MYLQTPLTSLSVSASDQLLALHQVSGTAYSSEGRVGMSPSSSMSPKNTGATVHHLGPTDLPFAHRRTPLQSDRRSSMDSSPGTDVHLSKRIKLEPAYDISSMSSSPLYYRTLYVKSREEELSELRSSFQEHMIELFFLENCGNLMDYVAWSKRPNIHINHLLQAASLDSSDESKPEDDVCHVCCC